MEQRLIDANALNNKLLHRIERTWGKEGAKVFAMIVSEIESAPTVETTDDVLARIPKFPQRTDYQCLIFDRGNWIFSNAEFKDNTYKAKDYAYGKTPLEAVTRLEESLNRK